LWPRWPVVKGLRFHDENGLPVEVLDPDMLAGDQAVLGGVFPERERILIGKGGVCHATCQFDISLHARNDIFH
jgi:hypothetical protein